MTKLFSFILLLAVPILFISHAKAQSHKNDSAFLSQHIQNLSSEKFAGREGGTSFEKAASEYIAFELKELKIKPFFGKSYFQNFVFEYDSQEYNSQNVAGFLNNKADSTIIIISHYDHIGNGGKLSKSYGKDGVHPGADDNCSGVAANFLLAQKIRKYKNKNYNYLFLFTGAHEKGLFGAKAFAEANKIDLSTISLVISLDMIGRLDENTKTIIFETENFVLSPDSLAIFSDNLIKFQNVESLVGDHSIFAEKGINTIIISTGIHDDYHKMFDTAEKINIKGICSIINLVMSYLNYTNPNVKFK